MSSRTEAVEQYSAALRAGRKYYNSAVMQGKYPYPQVLNDILEDSMTTGTMDLGIIDIPMDRIVGTWTSGRKSAFAGNFMPLLDADTEFGSKWITLCAAHLGEEGITDPIKCLEYLGRFYVQEGNKRVSVLKSYDSPSIQGHVIRMIPAPSEDPAIQRYYEFMQFYKLSKLYDVTFTRPGGYVKLQAALGFMPQQVWTEEESRVFKAIFQRFSAAFARLNTERLPLDAGDALLMCLKVHPFSELRGKTEEEMQQMLSSLWPDVRLLAKGEPISVSKEPEEKGKSLLNRIFGSPRLRAAFIYDFDPAKSAWASAHEQGQKYLEEKLGGEMDIRAYIRQDSAEEVMEQAVRDGANVIFATSPTLIDVCRKIAAAHKGICVYNCSLSMPYAGVRSYYCRIYEAKFICGAIAGAMAREDKIGYIANYPIMGVTAGINAFALGVRLTNPRARILLRWSCLPGDPIRDYLDKGISIISSRDADGAREYLAWNLGIHQIQPDGTLLPLASPRWNWGIFYERASISLMNGGIDAVRDSSRAVNDWWGISSGAVDVDLGEKLPSGVRQLANILKHGIAAEAVDPFLCHIRDQQGREISDGSLRFSAEELMRQDWFCENVIGGIPAFDELLPQSQNLVRLLGIYRQQIPPRTEEAAL